MLLAVPHSAHSAIALWLRRMGGPGLVLLGIADSSVIPLTGSIDVLTIWLSARHRSLWPFYAAMATTGAVVGGYITYGLARKGGKAALERRVPKTKVQGIYKKFARWGFGAVVVAALLPPPFPFVPFLLVAGAMQYSRKKFVAALALGRGVRFTIVAALGAIYGRHIVAFFNRYYMPAILVLIGLAVAGGLATALEYWRRRQERASETPTRQRARAA
jgi:membrane protein YqaA with SNARE-associated domain